jgi:hypothetical protein
MRSFHGSSRLLLCVVLAGPIALRAPLNAQSETNPNPPPPASPALPLTMQIKKTVVFLDTSCLHEFESEISKITKEQLLQMPPQQQLQITNQLLQLTSRLMNVRASKSKLNSDEISSLQQAQTENQSDRIAMADLDLSRASLLVKMTNLTQAEIWSMSPAELPLIPTDQHLGTGFFVAVPSSSPTQAGNKNQITGFGYLITNKHVAEPGIETDAPMPNRRNCHTDE